MGALRGYSRRAWAKVRSVAALSLLGLAVAGVCLALPATAMAGTSNLADPLPLPTPPLPSPPILPTPTLPVVIPPSPLPTPTLPVVVPTPPLPTPPVLDTPTPPLPTPTLPLSLGPSPSPSPAGTPGGPGAGGPSASGGGAGKPTGGGGPGHGIQLPLVGITLTSPLDVALLAVVAGLPLLLGIWLLLFARTWNEARRARHAQIRLAIANELGIRPRELLSVGTTALFKLREEAAFDELTGTLRRAAGMAALDREIARARRVKAPLTVAFVDLDGLKQANDKRGHKAGDELLRGLATVLKSGLRGQDLVTRYGGDEFVCVLPDTPADAARAKLSSMQHDGDAAGIRFSTGIAQLERSDDVVSLLARADMAMYEAKARRGEIKQLRPQLAPRSDMQSSPHLGT